MDLSGDDLAIALFLAGVAVAVALTAVTIHGWRNRTLLVSLWAAVILLASLAIGWHWIRGVFQLPLLSALSIDRARLLPYLLLMLVVPIGLAIRLDWLALKAWRPSVLEDVAAIQSAVAWLHPKDALRSFVDKELYDLYGRSNVDELIAKNEVIASEHEFRTAQRSGPRDAFGNQPPPSAAEVVARTRFDDATDKYEKALAYKDGLAAALKDQLCEKLAAGALVAKGLLEPVKAQDAEVMIPAFQWKVLNLDIDGARAKATGFSYLGVEIASPQ